METHLADRRITWLVAGTLLGMAISYYCPSEPAYAQTASDGEKFAMCTVNTIALNSDAVFVLDKVTGRLIGAGYNTQSGILTHSFIRNLANDFQASSNAQYVMVSGQANIRQSGGGANAQPASGAIYVGELTSGMVNMYGFYYAQSPSPVPTQELSLIASFPWRQSSN